MATTSPMMPSVLDREIGSNADDAFGHRHYAKALQSLIESPDNKPPFSIGLLGSWGTGKSSIKELYVAALKDSRDRNQSTTTITFNAWRYGNEDVKRALLRHVFLELGGDEKALRQQLFGQLHEAVVERKPFKEWLAETAEQFIPPLLFFGVVVLVLVLAIGLLIMSGGLKGWPASIAFSALSGLAWLFLRQTSFKPVALYKSGTTIQLPSTTAEQYEDLLTDQLKVFKKVKGRDCERLVIFVDDLDRLSSAEMVAGLDAVRTFLELPARKLPDKLGIIFVISCDEDRVAQALAGKRGRMGTEDLPGSVFNRTDARRYLDRLFQFRLEIPRFPKQDMREFARGKLDQFGKLSHDLASKGVQPQDVIDRLIHVGVQSPRNALQLLNAFAQSWWIAKQREQEGLGSKEPGGLHEGAVTSHPLALAAACVLRVDFPEFFGYLEERPDLVAAASLSILRGTVPFDEQPPRAREILAEFVESDKEGKLTRQMKPQHRPLRQYLSSLESLRWPPSLQPLLLLAVDAVTRQYGARANELWEAFVSGDVQGVLEVFGRSTDTKPLRTEDVRLLEDLAERAEEESDARQTNAGRVLAELPARLPAEQAHKLMTQLARVLARSEELRRHVRPKAAQQVVEVTGESDRRSVAASYVNDLLQPDDLARLRLPSGEAANLDQATDLIKEVCDLALWVRGEHGLPAETDGHVVEWLKHRTVTVGKDRTTLPFSDFESWMSEHEQHLLMTLGAEYTHLVVAQFEAPADSEADLSPALDRISRVFSELARDGEASRRTLWKQLSRLVAVLPQQATKKAWEEAAKHAPTANSEDASAFVGSMSVRLEQEVNDEEAWPLDWEAAATSLLDLVPQWLKEKKLSDESVESLTSLVVAWGKLEATSAFAERGHDLIKLNRPEFLSKIHEDWAATEFGELPLDAHKTLAADFSVHMNAKHKGDVVAELDRFVNASEVPADAAKIYRKFVAALSPKEWSTAPLSSHVAALFSRVVANAHNPDFLKEILPAATATMAHAPAGRTAAMLQPLFEQAPGMPAAYVAIHQHMRGRWPEENKQIGAYGAEVIFGRAAQFVREQGGTTGVGMVARSMARMITLKRVPESCLPVLAETVCAVWPSEPEVLRDALASIVAALTPEQVSQLAADMDETSNTGVEILRTTLRQVSEGRDSEFRSLTLQSLLDEQPIEVGGEPDGGLAMWIDAIEPHQAELLGEAFRQDSLNDTQSQRLLQQMLRIRALLGIESFTAILPTLIADENLETTRRTIFESTEEISSLANDGTAKAALNRCLITSLSRAADQTTISALGSWIRTSGGQAALEKRHEVLDELTHDDITTLANIFPESKVLQRRLENLSKEEAEEE